MSVDISGNILLSGYTTYSEIVDPDIITDGLSLWLDAGNSYTTKGLSTYYDCGYGCQYYSSDPGCVHCDARWLDMSGYGHDAILSGITTSYGNIGGYGDFTGSTSYGTVIRDVNISPTTMITLECWVNFSSTVDNQFFFLASTSSTAVAYRFLLDSAGYLMVTIQNDGTNNLSYSWNPSINKWYHVAMTWLSSASNLCKLYIDNVLVGSMSRNTTMSYNNNNIYVGGTPSGYCLKGSLAIARIYNRDLSVAELTQNYNTDRPRFYPVTTPPTQYLFSIYNAEVYNSITIEDVQIDGISVPVVPKYPIKYPHTSTGYVNASSSARIDIYLSGTNNYLTTTLYCAGACVEIPRYENTATSGPYTLTTSITSAKTLQVSSGTCA